jgi:hypothetical protein
LLGAVAADLIETRQRTLQAPIPNNATKQRLTRYDFIGAGYVITAKSPIGSASSKDLLRHRIRPFAWAELDPSLPVELD